jgi:hypothetical protein
VAWAGGAQRYVARISRYRDEDTERTGTFASLSAVDACVTWGNATLWCDSLEFLTLATERVFPSLSNANSE